MAFRRSSLMRGESFRARETVATEIPNSRAMSFIVMGALSSIWFLMIHVAKILKKINSKHFH
jgi:hypothetical protein